MAGHVPLRQFQLFWQFHEFYPAVVCDCYFSVCDSISEGEAVASLPGNRIVGGDFSQVDSNIATLLLFGATSHSLEDDHPVCRWYFTGIAAILANLSGCHPICLPVLCYGRGPVFSTGAQLADGADSRFDDDYRAADKEASITEEFTK